MRKLFAIAAPLLLMGVVKAKPKFKRVAFVCKNNICYQVNETKAP